MLSFEVWDDISKTFEKHKASLEALKNKCEEYSIWKTPPVYVNSPIVVSKKKEVSIPIEDAKLIFEALLRLPVEGNKAILKQTLIPLKERIEKAEKESGVTNETE